MRVFVFVALFATVVGTAAFAYDPYPFQRSDGKWGYVNDDHCWVIEPQFEEAGHFAEELALISIGRMQGFIDQTGAIKIDPQFVSEQNWHFPSFAGFSNGLHPVQFEGKWGFIEKTGAMVISSQFERAESFSEGLAAVLISDKWGFVDTESRIRINPQFDSVRSFEGGLARVNIDEKWGFIDVSGEIVITPQFDGPKYMCSSRDTICPDSLYLEGCILFFRG